MTFAGATHFRALMPRAGASFSRLETAYLQAYEHTSGIKPKMN